MRTAIVSNLRQRKSLNSAESLKISVECLKNSVECLKAWPRVCVATQHMLSQSGTVNIAMCNKSSDLIRKEIKFNVLEDFLTV